MKSAVLTAGIDSPGINEGREQFVKVEMEVTGKVKILNIFMDLELCEDGFEREIAKVENGGLVRDFFDAIISSFLIEFVNLQLKMGNGVVNAFLLPGFNRAKGLVDFMSGPLLLMAIEAFINGEIGTPFEFGFFKIKRL